MGTAASSADADGNNADTTPATNGETATDKDEESCLKQVNHSNNILKDRPPLDSNEGKKDISTVGLKTLGESSVVAEVDKCEGVEGTTIGQKAADNDDNNKIIEKPSLPEDRGNDEVNDPKKLSEETSVVAGDDTICDKQVKDKKLTSIAEGSDMGSGTSGIVGRTTAGEKSDNDDTKRKLQPGLEIVENEDNLSRASTDASTVSESIGEDGNVVKRATPKTAMKENENTIPENVKVPTTSPSTNSKTTALGLPSDKNEHNNKNVSSTKPTHTEEHESLRHLFMPPKSKPSADKASLHPGNYIAPNASLAPMTASKGLENVAPALPSATVVRATVTETTDDNIDATTRTATCKSDEPDSFNPKAITGGLTPDNGNPKSSEHSPEQQQPICASLNGDQGNCQGKQQHQTETSETTTEQPPSCDGNGNIGIPGTQKEGTEGGPEMKLAPGKKVHSPTNEKGGLASSCERSNDNVLSAASKSIKVGENSSSVVEPEKNKEEECSDHAEDPMAAVKLNENAGKRLSERKEMMHSNGSSGKEITKLQTVNGERNVTGTADDTADGEEKQRGALNNALIPDDSTRGEGPDAMQRVPSRDSDWESDVAKSPTINGENCCRLSGTDQNPMEVDSTDGGQKQGGELPYRQTPVANAASSDVAGATPEVSTMSIQCGGKDVASQSIDTVRSTRAKDPPSNCREDTKSSKISQTAKSSDAGQEFVKTTTTSRLRAEAGKYDSAIDGDHNPEITDEPSRDVLEATKTPQSPNCSKVNRPENNSSTLHVSGAVLINSPVVNDGGGHLNNISSGTLKEPSKNYEDTSLNVEETLKVGPERTQKLPTDPNNSTKEKKAETQQGSFGDTHPEGASVKSDKAEAAEEPPKSLMDIARRTKETTRQHHKLMLMRLFTGSKENVLKIAKMKEENVRDEPFHSEGKGTLTQRSVAPSANLAGLLPSALLEFRRQNQFNNEIALRPQRDSYRSMPLSGLNTWIQLKSAKRKRNKTLPFLFEYNECSIAAISRWATQPDSDTSSQDERDSRSVKSAAAYIDRPTCASTFRKCSLCGSFGHYEVECRERGMKPNQTVELASEIKVNALCREMKARNVNEQAGEIAVASSADRQTNKDKEVPDREILCKICHSGSNENQMLACDGCERLYHVYCVNPPLKNIPRGEWLCDDCKQPISDTSNYDVDVEACEGFLIEQRKRPRVCKDRNERKLSPFRDWQMLISAVSATATHATSMPQSSVGRKRQRPCNDIDGISIVAASTSSTGETSTKNMRSAAASRSSANRRAASTSSGTLGDDNVDQAPGGNSLVPGTVVAWFDERSSIANNAKPFLGVILGVNSYSKKILVRVIQQDCSRVVLGENEGSSTEDVDYEFIQNTSAGATIWHDAGNLHVVAAAAGQGSMNQFQDILPSRLKKKKRRST